MEMRKVSIIVMADSEIFNSKMWQEEDGNSFLVKKH
jgi:hypothetical protein